MSTNNTTLSLRRIIITLLGFISIPFIKNITESIIHNELASYTFAFSLIGIFLTFLNWDLLCVHLQRFTSDIKESLFFTLFGTIFLALLFVMNYLLLNAYVPLINPEEFKEFTILFFPILYSYTVLFSSLYIISFKSLTDRLGIKKAELTVIFFSGFLFSLLFTMTFIPFSVFEWLKGYLFYFLVTTVLSYLYNQTKSLFPSLIALSICLLGMNLFLIFF